MIVKCKNCGAEIDDCDIRCSKCGYINGKNEENISSKPQTIEELKKWYIDSELPNEEIARFFIGKNIQEPRAFGIYKDECTGNFVVYKNKDDGTRTIRYEGDNEQLAVYELYMRLLEEIANQNYNIKHNISKKVPIENIIEKEEYTEEDNSSFFYNLWEDIKEVWLKRIAIALGIIGIIALGNAFRKDLLNERDDYYYKKSYYDSDSYSRDRGTSSSRESSSSWDSSSTDWSSDW